MISAAEFYALTSRIIGLGYSEELASDYAARIGDIRTLDASGNLLVLSDSGQVIATLPASILDPADPPPNAG